mmetsp:Transcript_31734/g.67269  ORF Transcript_31734/g.67269 Transcript_31734/m.67269 type:complete len:221 (+) Transcript_31734:1510-2172(+)
MPPGMSQRRPLGPFLSPRNGQLHPSHHLHGNRKLLRSHIIARQTTGRSRRILPSIHQDRSRRRSHPQSLSNHHGKSPQILIPRRNDRRRPGAPKHPSPHPHGHGLPLRPTPPLGARTIRIPPRPRQRQRRRRTPRLHDQIRLLLRRHQPHRRNLQARPQTDAHPHLLRIPRLRRLGRNSQRPAHGGIATHRLRRRHGRSGTFPNRRRRHGHDLRRARLLR